MTVFDLEKEVVKDLSNISLQDNLKKIPPVLYSFKNSLQFLDLSNNLLDKFINKVIYCLLRLKRKISH